MRHVSQCLNTQIMNICRQSIKLEELNAKVGLYLPETLREHCHVGSFKNSCLILIVSNAVWASQLRYMLPELRDKLRSEAGIYQLASIKITVMMTDIASNTPSKPKSRLSARAREMILSESARCTDAALKQALLQLGSNDR